MRYIWYGLIVMQLTLHAQHFGRIEAHFACVFGSVRSATYVSSAFKDVYVFGSESSATQVLSGLSKITSGCAYSKWYALWWLSCLHLENLWRVTVAYQRYFYPFFWNFWRYQKPYIQLLSKSKYKVHCTF